jgi:hypothetical protein
MEAAQNLIPTIQSIDPDLLPHSIAELRPYVSIADKEDVDLTSRLNDIFKQLSQVTDTLILTALGARTATDFTATCVGVFNGYVRAMRVKSDLLRVILKDDLPSAARIVDRGLNGLEFAFRDCGIKQFGSAVTEQAEFTIWTRRKTAALVWRLLELEVLNHPLSPGVQELSNTLYSEFALAAAWSQLHLDCLTTAMRLKKAIYPDVLPAVVEGLRAEVNAYAAAKRMIDLFLPPVTEEKLAPYVWDNEDEELLASSMQDMETEELEEY